VRSPRQTPVAIDHQVPAGPMASRVANTRPFQRKAFLDRRIAEFFPVDIVERRDLDGGVAAGRCGFGAFRKTCRRAVTGAAVDVA